MGAELEVQFGRGCDTHSTIELVNSVQSITSNDMPFYFKPDASVSNGIEMISHPATLAYHMKMWDRVLGALTGKGYKSHDASCACGLHIHMNKDCLSDAEKIRLSYFVNSQRARVIKIARRENSRWAAYVPMQENAAHEADFIYSCNVNQGKYAALNWGNRYTLEFRLFKGTLNGDSLKACFQFVHASVRFIQSVASTSSLIANGVDAAWVEFCSFIASSDKYDELISMMFKKNIYMSEVPVIETREELRESAAARIQRNEERDAARERAMGRT
jgi:hypothetical protein